MVVMASHRVKGILKAIFVLNVNHPKMPQSTLGKQLLQLGPFSNNPECDDMTGGLHQSFFL